MDQLSLELYNSVPVIAISLVVSVLLIVIVNLLRKKNGRIRLSLFKLLEIEIQFQDSDKQ